MDYPETDVTSFVLERAQELGDKPALIDGPTGRTVTYAELDQATRALAAGLAARGFGPGDCLCVYMPNLPEYAIAFHGVARAGGKASTANPLYTARELQHQLEDSESKYLLTIPQFLDVATTAAEAAGVEEIFVVGEADGATPLSESDGQPGGGARHRHLRRRSRRPAVLERHDRPAQGRDAHSREPGRQPRPDPGRVRDLRRRRPGRCPALLPHLRADGDHEPGPPLWGDDRLDAALRPRPVPGPDPGARDLAALRCAADRPRARQAPGGRRARPLVGQDRDVRRRAAGGRACPTRSPSASSAT